MEQVTDQQPADQPQPQPHPQPQPPAEHAEPAAPTRFERAVSRGLARVTGAALGPYQTAVVRIGFAATWLFFLLREWPHRHEMYGPDGPWSWELAERLIDSNHAFTVLLWSDSAGWFECVYLLAIAASVTLLLGWRTRTSSVLFMIGVLALQNRSVFMGDGGDNVIHLISMYLVLTRCGQVWSLDARRLGRQRAGLRNERDVTGVVLWTLLGAVLAGATVTGGLSLGWGLFCWLLWAAQAVWWLVNRYGPGSEARGVCDIIANLAHNGALLVIVAEVCLIYSTAGWYKIQGSRWQDGTAVYYPMHLDYFAPWPELNSVLAGNGLVILLITYGTVAVQVAFPFTLFNRRVKNVLLAAMITEHLSISVLLGLPFFSMAMIAADAVFLPTAALVWLGARASGGSRRLRLRLGRGRGDGGRGGPDGRAGVREDTEGGVDGAAESAPVPPQQWSGDGASVR
ncbi:MAG: HTTM domain-containing protein [Streptomyces sp.]